MYNNIRAITHINYMSKSDIIKAYTHNDKMMLRYSRNKYLYMTRLTSIGILINFEAPCKNTDFIKDTNYLAYSSYIFTVMLNKAIG